VRAKKRILSLGAPRMIDFLGGSLKWLWSSAADPGWWVKAAVDSTIGVTDKQRRQEQKADESLMGPDDGFWAERGWAFEARHGSRDDWLGLLRKSIEHDPRHEAAERLVLRTTNYHPIVAFTRHTPTPLEENARHQEIPVGLPLITHRGGSAASPPPSMGVPDQTEGGAAAHMFKGI